MQQTILIDRANLRSIVNKRRPSMADAIALAESQLLFANGDIDIEDVTAKVMQQAPGWAVTFTFTKVEPAPAPLPKAHTIGGKVLGVERGPGEYGETHDLKCPGCADSPFTASPRSESYWSA